MSALGFCESKNHLGEPNCGGDLCVRGAVVTCSRCGRPHDDHPETKANLAAQAAKQEIKPVVVPPIDYAIDYPQRLKRLEEVAAQQGAKIARLEEQLAGRKKTG